MTANTKEQVIVALVRGLKRIESGWTQGATARNLHGLSLSGMRLDADADGACAWCMVGAFCDVKVDRVWNGVCGLLRDAIIVLGLAGRSPVVGSLTMWNDTEGRTRGEVLSVYRRALLLASAIVVEEAEPRA